jgi:hypothetical protein
MASLDPFVAAPSTVSVRLEPSREASASALRWSGIALVATVWGSATLFGLYILAFYAAALAEGKMATWNGNLAGLYVPGARVATAGIGLHFAAGGVILALGCIQLMAGVRKRWPAVHRWIGRVYVTAAFLAGVGGLTFILTNGTIGGTAMNLGFGGYGVLMVIVAVQAYRHARARRLDAHRVWALRLFALAIGSWLYRMDYGFWLLLTDGIGHTQTFTGPFDHVMAFFFYIPNLLVAEMFIRARRVQAGPAMRIAAAGALAAATGFLLLGTYYFTKIYWGPAILARLGL